MHARLCEVCVNALVMALQFIGRYAITNSCDALVELPDVCLNGRLSFTAVVTTSQDRHMEYM